MLVFQTSSPESRLGAAIYLSERIYHASVRKVRQKHGNALLSILVTIGQTALFTLCLLYTSPSPRDRTRSRMPSSA